MDHIRGLRFGPLDNRTIHVCVDMQRLFAVDSPWASSAVEKALPGAREVTLRKPRETIFTRFLCPRAPKDLPGQWQQLYLHCPQMTQLDRRLFSVIPELENLGREAKTIDRHVFSIFASQEFQLQLLSRSAKALVFTGVEADVCVLASIFSAIDGGYRVVVVSDAVASSNDAGHRAALEGILPRFDQQVEVVDVEELLSSWP